MVQTSKDGIPTMASVYKIGVLYLERKERLKEMNG